MHQDAEAGKRQVYPKNKLMVGSDEKENMLEGSTLARSSRVLAFTLWHQE